MRTGRKAPRGQAMLELALGMTVFVTVLLFGIHFAELGFMSLKVTEAAEAAMLDTTAFELHDWPNDASPASTAASSAQSEVQLRYADFDGRYSAVGGSSTFTQVVTQGTALAVQCNVGGGPGFNADIHVAMAYSDNGGLVCNAAATTSTIRLATSFLDGAGGLFTKSHAQATRDVPFCAIGRASGGSCSGKLETMLDDWGLSDPQAGTCPLIGDIPIPCPTATAYWTMAASVFLTNGAGMGFSGSQLAQFTVTQLPFPFFFGAENMFWMSSMGEPELFLQPLGSEGHGIWGTSPGHVPIIGGSSVAGGLYFASFIGRNSCFLGKSC